MEFAHKKNDCPFLFFVSFLFLFFLEMNIFIILRHNFEQILSKGIWVKKEQCPKTRESCLFLLEIYISVVSNK